MSGHGPVGAAGTARHAPAPAAAARPPAQQDADTCRPATSPHPARDSTRHATAFVGGSTDCHDPRRSDLQQRRCHESAPAVRGGGGPALAGAGATTDPARVALAAMLSQCSEQPSAQAGSILRQASTALASGLARLAEALRSMAGMGTSEASALATASRADDRAAVPAGLLALQPPPPPSAQLTWDPVRGIITELAPGMSAAGPSDGDGASDGEGPPSSWVPIASMVMRLDLRMRVGRLIRGLDVLLERLSLSRLHLLVMTLVAPVLLALAIDVTVRLLE